MLTRAALPQDAGNKVSRKATILGAQNIVIGEQPRQSCTVRYNTLKVHV